MHSASDIADAEVMKLCKELRLTVHVRGTDTHPVVEFRCKGTRRVIGGIELKRRMANL